MTALAPLPPHNDEAEQAVLGSMLLDRDAVCRGVEALQPEDFYRDAHGLIFQAMVELSRHEEAVDIITVSHKLSGTGKLEAAGGATYLASLPNATPTAANVEYYVRIVRTCAARRAIIAEASRLQDAAFNGDDPAVIAAGARDTFARLTVLQRTIETMAPYSVPNLAALLDGVAELLRRFVVFASPYQVVACALWVAHTHAYDRFEVSPFLHIKSSEKRSGKTRLLEVLELSVRVPWRVVSPTEAVLFRKIDADHPTVLLDEVDTIFGRGHDNSHEPLRALLNAGNRRGVTTPRCVREGNEIRLVEFDVFTPRVLAGIGTLPDTVVDRSIPIHLQRRARHERIEWFRSRQAGAVAEPIRRDLERWAVAAGEALEQRRPNVPVALNDRAAELWEPLLAIAEMAGGDWPSLAREAAVALHGDRLAQEETVGVALLRAIKETFDDNGASQMTTVDLLAALVGRDDGPWAEWWGKQVADKNTQGPAARLARLLRPFGITSKSIRLDDGRTPKGYALADFEDAFNRYIGSFPALNRHTATRLDYQASEGRRDAATDPSRGDIGMACKALQDKECGGVAASHAQVGEGTVVVSEAALRCGYVEDRASDGPQRAIGDVEAAGSLSIVPHRRT